MTDWRFHGVTIAWLVILAYWVAKARDVKITARSESRLSRIGHIGPLFIAGGLMIHPVPEGFDALNEPLFPFTLPVLFVGDVLLVAGVAICLWARHTLGRNWSANVMQKSDHELIQHGPFRFVRHPIYTGLLLTMVATTVLIDEWRCVLATVIAYLAFLRKYRLEERFMADLFGEQYVTYKSRVPALVPHLWALP